MYAWRCNRGIYFYRRERINEKCGSNEIVVTISIDILIAISENVGRKINNLIFSFASQGEPGIQGFPGAAGLPVRKHLHSIPKVGSSSSQFFQSS